MKTKITLELLKRVHKEVSRELKEAIELEVPEVKPSLEIGRWYIVHSRSFLIDALVFYDDATETHYGFNHEANWTASYSNLNNIISGEIRLATPEEVETALVRHFGFLGFKFGCYLNNSNIHGGKFKNSKKNEGYFKFIDNELRLYENESLWFVVFKNGTWAEIITEPTEKELLIEKLNELKEKATELETQINQMKCETK